MPVSAKQATKTAKRIHKVTIKRMVDESPDTSWLGEYGNSARSDYAIDRAHDTDCNSQTPITSEADAHLASAVQYLEDLQSEEEGQLEHSQGCSYRFSDAAECSCIVSAIYTGVNDALEILYETRDNECDCGRSGRWSGREYRYFNPNHENYKGDTEENIRKYCRQDYERMESLNSGQWCFVGVRAEAEVFVLPKTSLAQSVATVQTITSGGLWGIESDSDKGYFAEVEAEELSALREQLAGIGFSSRAIAAAFKGVVREDGD